MGIQDEVAGLPKRSLTIYCLNFSIASFSVTKAIEIRVIRCVYRKSCDTCISSAKLKQRNSQDLLLLFHINSQVKKINKIVLVQLPTYYCAAVYESSTGHSFLGYLNRGNFYLVRYPGLKTEV